MGLATEFVTKNVPDFIFADSKHLAGNRIKSSQHVRTKFWWTKLPKI